MRLAARRAPVLAVAALLLARAAAADDRVVMIADSHGVGRWGEVMASWLRGRAATRFKFFASGASAPLQWLNDAFNTPCGFEDDSSIARPAPRRCRDLHTPTLAKLWVEQGPKPPGERRVTVIALGTNYAMSGGSRREQVEATRRLAEAAMSGDRCVWIGPPNMNRQHGYDAAGVEYKVGIIREALAAAAQRTSQPACQFVDSRLVSKYPTTCGDGIHYHWPGQTAPDCVKAAEDWANAVAARVDRLLAAPPGP